MTNKVYRTAQGKAVDIGSLLLQNENTKAVGNMGVNARGDQVSPTNTPIATRDQRVAKQYASQVKRTNVVDAPILASRHVATTQKEVAAMKEKGITSAPVSVEEAVAAEASALVEEPKGLTGLAGAIAKARQVKQTAEKPAKQQAKEKPGITKI